MHRILAHQMPQRRQPVRVLAGPRGDQEAACTALPARRTPPRRRQQACRKAAGARRSSGGCTARGTICGMCRETWCLRRGGVRTRGRAAITSSRRPGALPPLHPCSIPRTRAKSTDSGRVYSVAAARAGDETVTCSVPLVFFGVELPVGQPGLSVASSSHRLLSLS